ncbi:MAG: transglutaminase domain-containing protein [Sedimentisphaerales bacterium]|nr:transglutaminase domain-containing protein [Sedimentisphaerales bacterium]
MNLQKLILVTILTCFYLLCNCGIAYSWQYVGMSIPENDLKGVVVKCEMSHIISVSGKTPTIRMIAQIPQSVPNIQKINRVEFSVEPRRYFSRNGDKYAEIIINNPDKIEKVVITILAELYRYDLQTALNDKKKNQFQETGLEEFLKEEKYIEKNDSNLSEIAASIKGTSEIEIVRNIYNYVLNNMEYLMQGKKDRGALYALKHKKGDCSEYSDLFVALCRAKKIPARVITGISVQRDTKTARHNWAEVYLKDYGWVPFDPSKGDVRSISRRDKLFNSLEPAYIYFSNIRNDITLRNYHYCLFTYYGDQVRTSDSIKFEFPEQLK